MKDDITAAYTYNPDGLRISKTVNGETTTHILDGSNVVADIKGGNISKYNRGRGLISMEQNGDKGYYVFNGHGDVSRLVGSDSSEKFQRTFNAFGETVLSGSEDLLDNPFGYAGEYTDEETGNIYLRARYYDPATGRFTSQDPARDGTNWYSYAGNNPVMFFDPTGYWQEGDQNLPQEAQFAIQYYTRKWEEAETQVEKDAAHAAAEAVRTGNATVEGVWKDMPHYYQGQEGLCFAFVTVMILNTSFGVDTVTPISQETAEEKAEIIARKSYESDYVKTITPDKLSYENLYDALATYGPQSAVYYSPGSGTHSIAVAGVIRVTREVDGEEISDTLVITLNPQDHPDKGTESTADYGPLTQGKKYSVTDLSEFKTQYGEQRGAGFNLGSMSVEKYNRKKEIK